MFTLYSQARNLQRPLFNLARPLSSTFSKNPKHQIMKTANTKNLVRAVGFDLAGGTLVSKAKQLCDTLRSQGYLIFITAACTQSILATALERFKEQGFRPDFSIASDRVLYQPRPDKYLAALKEMSALSGLPIGVEHCVHIADTDHGIMGANMAGTWTVKVADTRTIELSETDNSTPHYRIPNVSIYHVIKSINLFEKLLTEKEYGEEEGYLPHHHIDPAVIDEITSKKKGPNKNRYL